MHPDHVSDESKIHFGKLISNKRKEKKLTLKDVSEYCGVSINFISLIERGIKSPSDNVIVRLSDILEMDEYLLLKYFNKLPPLVKTNVNKAIYEHDGLKELFGELSEKVKDESLREKLYDEVYEVYLDFLKRNNLIE